MLPLWSGAFRRLLEGRLISQEWKSEQVTHRSRYGTVQTCSTLWFSGCASVGLSCVSTRRMEAPAPSKVNKARLYDHQLQLPTDLVLLLLWEGRHTANRDAPRVSLLVSCMTGLSAAAPADGTYSTVLLVLYGTSLVAGSRQYPRQPTCRTGVKRARHGNARGGCMNGWLAGWLHHHRQGWLTALPQTSILPQRFLLHAI